MTPATKSLYGHRGRDRIGRKEAIAEKDELLNRVNAAELAANLPMKAP